VRQLDAFVPLVTYTAAGAVAVKRSSIDSLEPLLCELYFFVRNTLNKALLLERATASHFDMDLAHSRDAGFVRELTGKGKGVLKSVKELIGDRPRKLLIKLMEKAFDKKDFLAMAATTWPPILKVEGPSVKVLNNEKLMQLVDALFASVVVWDKKDSSDKDLGIVLRCIDALLEISKPALSNVEILKLDAISSCPNIPLVIAHAMASSVIDRCRGLLDETIKVQRHVLSVGAVHEFTWQDIEDPGEAADHVKQATAVIVSGVARMLTLSTQELFKSGHCVFVDKGDFGSSISLRKNLELHAPVTPSPKRRPGAADASQLLRESTAVAATPSAPWVSRRPAPPRRRAQLPPCGKRATHSGATHLRTHK
jgi:hypothetical protein